MHVFFPYFFRALLWLHLVQKASFLGRKPAFCGAWTCEHAPSSSHLKQVIKGKSSTFCTFQGLKIGDSWAPPTRRKKSRKTTASEIFGTLGLLRRVPQAFFSSGDTVDGRNPAPVDRIWYFVYTIMCRHSYIPGGCLGISSINSMGQFGKMFSQGHVLMREVTWLNHSNP